MSCDLAVAGSAEFVLQEGEACSDRCSTRFRLQQRACQQRGTDADTLWLRTCGSLAYLVASAPPTMMCGHCHLCLQVIAVACEDGTCSLWLWSQGVCVDNLQLPPGTPHGIVVMLMAYTLHSEVLPDDTPLSAAVAWS